jgi:hypothetical protein
MSVDDALLAERFSELAGSEPGDWDDVRRRARRRVGRTVAVIAAVAVALIAAGFAVGGQVIGLFDVHGKRVPLSSLSARDREVLTTLLCPRVELRTIAGKAPERVCLSGEPTIDEIADDGSQITWRVRYPWGATCLVSHSPGGYHDPNRGDTMIGSISCSSTEKGLVPTPGRPITVDVAAGADRAHPEMRVLSVSGLAGEGIAKVELVSPDGSRLGIDVRGHAYSLRHVPTGHWTAIVALDASGDEVYRDSLPSGSQPHTIIGPPKAPPPLRTRAAHPAGRPVQRAATSVALVEVYRNGVVTLRFASSSGDVYRRLTDESRPDIDIQCARVAYGAGRWNGLGGSGNAPVAKTIVARIDNRVSGDVVSPPFDYCEVGGIYGRRWTTPAGAHELVEVPFTELGRRYLDERATARDLAYFVRGTKLQRLRRAMHRGEAAPSAPEIARRFGKRVVPLGSPNGNVPQGKVGVWSDGTTIVASELTRGGRRLYVTVRGVRIGATNVRDLAFVF